jgi:hypothetical protein
LNPAQLDEGPRQEGFVTGHDFSRADKLNQTIGALAPEVGFSSSSTGSQLSQSSDSTAVGLLELPEHPEEAREVEITPETGPQIVPSLAASEDTSNTDSIRSAVAQALSANGHATAAVLIEDGKWIIEGSSVRIEVSAKPTMIRLTFNAGAEKLIRQALTQAGAPTRFMIVPGEGQATVGSAPKARAPLGAIETEARTHPLVVQAQSLFNAEIVSVVDLREK